MQKKYNNFTPSHPRIGLDRTFIRTILLDPNKDIDCDESQFFENESISDANFIENLLNLNSEKIEKYKNEGCICIYDERTYDFPRKKITYYDLIEMLENDDNTEIILDKYKGRWINSLNEIIPIESLKNFSEVLFKFNPQYPLNVQFESRFESGNLRMAIKVKEYEYDLIVNNDINSGKSSNWFYFRVTFRNTGRINIAESPFTYKFNIINCQKPDTLFSKGLKVLCFSSVKKIWNRHTRLNYYFSNGLNVEEKKLYNLTFTYDLNYNFTEENLYFAYCFPYTYTNLQNYLSSLLNNPILLQKNIIRHEIIGKSLSENNLDMLIITKFDSNFDDIALRPCIVLTGRVHPGESNASYAIQGAIDFLLDLQNPAAEKLRKSFIFKIVPMLNPDGVINGNFRTSLVGKDLNRLWDEPKENFSPTIYYTKEMMKKTLESREIYLFCDFHGHSNKPNFFLYGCPTSRKNKVQFNLGYHEMILPRIFGEKNDIFDQRSCIYKVIVKKMKTARAVVRNELSIDLSYCLESSIGYISIGDNKFKFFTPTLYNKIGFDFCLSLRDLLIKEIFFENLIKIQADEALKLSMNNEIKVNPLVISNINNNIINLQKDLSSNSNCNNNGIFSTTNYNSNNFFNSNIFNNNNNANNQILQSPSVNNNNSNCFNLQTIKEKNEILKEIKEIKEHKREKEKNKDKEIKEKEKEIKDIEKEKLNLLKNNSTAKEKFLKNNLPINLIDIKNSENKQIKLKTNKEKKICDKYNNNKENNYKDDFKDFESFKSLEKKMKKKKKKLTPIKRRKSKLKDSEKLDNSSNSINLINLKNNNSFTSFTYGNSINTRKNPNNLKMNSNLKSSDNLHITNNSNCYNNNNCIINNNFKEIRSNDMLNNCSNNLLESDFNHNNFIINNIETNVYSGNNNNIDSEKLREISTSRNKILESSKIEVQMKNNNKCILFSDKSI
jgi:hypothetical protein